MNSVIFYAHRSAHAGSVIPEAEIKFSAVVAVYSGTISYTSDNVNYTLSGGDVLCLKEGSLRSRCILSASDQVSIHFAEERTSGLPTFIKGGVTPLFRKLADVCDAVKASGGDGAAARIGKLADCMIDELRAHVRESSEDPAVRSIKAFLAERTDKKTTLADVGAYMHFSPNYCQTIFKKSTGKTIVDYLIGLRIERAKTLLEDGSVEFREIAALCGFSDYNYFSRVFHAKTGRSPLRYRKTVCYD